MLSASVIAPALGESLQVGQTDQNGRIAPSTEEASTARFESLAKSGGISPVNWFRSRYNDCGEAAEFDWIAPFNLLSPSESPVTRPLESVLLTEAASLSLPLRLQLSVAW